MEFLTHLVKYIFDVGMMLFLPETVEWKTKMTKMLFVIQNVCNTKK